MTQGEAATRAGVSLATWRRLESATESVSFRRSTVAAVERVLRLPSGGLGALQAGDDVPEVTRVRLPGADWKRRVARSFTGDPLSPRQAFKIGIATAGMEDDAFVRWDDYLQGRCTADDLWLISGLPDWVLFIVNPVWLQCFRRVFVEIGRKIENGIVPYPECVAECVALWLTIRHAEETADDVHRDMIDGDPETAALLLDHGDTEDDWDGVAEALCDDFDFRMIWWPNVTRVIFGDPGGPYHSWHPYRWWEIDTGADTDDTGAELAST